MIRFIDIRSQGTGYRFAFWDTVTNRFVDLDDEQAWDSFADFEESAKGNTIERDLQRYKNLCPEWAFNSSDNDIEGFYLTANDCDSSVSDA